ncbi:ATP-binding cassette domain-containing protein [Paenibacillus sp. GCM10023252]|uniref:ABC transporter ATP-binding protein n=1 Tax=Paenibacillus sp. GCM10023252 TaxID=3252649 RepID=UPI0036074038
MIRVTQLHKQFRSPVPKEGAFKGLRGLFSREVRVKEAVRDVSFTIQPGEFVGYIGPNGAGKSTTIKMLAGILHPTSGEVSIGGLNPHRSRRQVARKLGVLFGQRTQLWWDLPVKDSYEILAAMYGIPQERAKTRLAMLRELLQLGEFYETPVRKLSLGQRMRADLAAALLHDPDILFLDEPTIGLDLIAKRNIRSFLREINTELGKTILLTTHDMDDIEQLCSRVMVINNGELGFDGSISELRKRIGLPSVLQVKYRKDSLPDEDGILHIQNSTDSALRCARSDGDAYTFECDRERLSAMEALRMLESLGAIVDVHMEEPHFEDIIHRVY